jgi:methyltransferase
MTWFWIAYGWCLATRMFELVRSRSNASYARRQGARNIDDGFVPMVLVHVGWFAGLLAEQYGPGPAYAHTTLQLAAAVLFVLSEGLRFWCIATLGKCWNVRVLVIPQLELVARGPYRFMPHPNYLAVVVGLVALPLALGLPYTAALVLPLKLLVLKRRIRIERGALADL